MKRLEPEAGRYRNIQIIIIIIVPMQCTGNSDSFALGRKAISHGTALPIFLKKIPRVPCFVQIWVIAVHTKAQTSLH